MWRPVFSSTPPIGGMTAGWVGARIGCRQLVSLSDITTLSGTEVASRSAGSAVGDGSGTKVGKGPVKNRRVLGWRGEQADKNTSKKSRLDIFLIKILYHMTNEISIIWIVIVLVFPIFRSADELANTPQAKLAVPTISVVVDNTKTRQLACFSIIPPAAQRAFSARVGLDAQLALSSPLHSYNSRQGITD